MQSLQFRLPWCNRGLPVPNLGATGCKKISSTVSIYMCAKVNEFWFFALSTWLLEVWLPWRPLSSALYWACSVQFHLPVRFFFFSLIKLKYRRCYIRLQKLNWLVMMLCCLFVFAVGFHKGKACCTRYNRKPVPFQFIKGYREQTTMENCHIEAIM